MALTGKIADWSLADILQLVTAEHKSGVLTLSFAGEEIRFEFHQGGIVNARSRRSGPSGKTGKAGRGAWGARNGDAGGEGLVTFLGDTGRIQPNQVEMLQGLAGEYAGDEFRAAIRGNVLSPDALEEGLTEYTQELLHRVLTWPSGDYSFVSRTSSSVAPEFVLSTEGLLFEGMRRIDEAPRIETVVRPETVFRRKEGVTIPGELAPQEVEILALVDGVRSAGKLARAARISEHTTAKNLRRLHQLGLIEIVAIDSEEAPLVDLTLDDLEPAPRRNRVLRVASLVLLFAASVAFRALSHRDFGFARDAAIEGSPQLTSGHDHRVAQATGFACALFRAAYGREPASTRELRSAGLLPAGYWEEAARPYVGRGPAGDSRSLSAD